MTSEVLANDNNGLQIEVVPLRNDPSRWLVEAIDFESDGDIHRAIFSGPRAKEFAYGYADGWGGNSLKRIDPG